MTNEPTAEPKIEPWMIGAAQAIADMDASRMSDREFYERVLEIIARIERRVQSCPRCQRVDEYIKHREFIHVAELKAVIDQ